MIIDQLITARNFDDSFFCLGEPNLILVPSGKVNLHSYIRKFVIL